MGREYKLLAVRYLQDADVLTSALLYHALSFSLRMFARVCMRTCVCVRACVWAGEGGMCARPAKGIVLFTLTQSHLVVSLLIMI